MNEYFTQEELRKRLVKSSFTADELTEVTALREAISRMVDDYLGVEDGYFIAPTVATTRRIYGSGGSSHFLPLPVYGSVTVTAPAGITVPNFTVEGNNLLTLTEDDRRSPLIVWTYGMPYDVTGFWGYSAIPPQIREACLEIAARIFRERPAQGVVGMVGELQTQEGFRGFPTTARVILDNFKKKLTTEVEGGSLYIA